MHACPGCGRQSQSLTSSPVAAMWVRLHHPSDARHWDYTLSFYCLSRRAMERALAAYQSKVPKAYPYAVHDSAMTAAMDLYRTEASGPAVHSFSTRLQQVEYHCTALVLQTSSLMGEGAMCGWSGRGALEIIASAFARLLGDPSCPREISAKRNICQEKYLPRNISPVAPRCSPQQRASAAELGTCFSMQ